jgi:(S)-2-hydroxyglutarate dehydrogenase
MKSDYVVVGGGLVGLSTAYQLLRAKPGASVCVLEKEPAVATHQSTHNSGVIHTGIYYKPDSLKARLCVEGRRAILDFAEEHGVRHSICGKLIVATSDEELKRLKILHARAQSNGVDVSLLSPEEMREKEPHVAGVGGVWVPGAGVIDFAGLAQALVKEISRMGGEVMTNARLRAATRTGVGWILSGTFDLIHAGYVVNCAGLHSDSVARKFGDRTEGRIVPFRGEYYTLRESARKLCNTLIYPVPDPRVPFLGVHFTRRFDGTVECGPNAVLALAREGYSWRDVNGRDVMRMIRFGGFRRHITQNWRVGAEEIFRSLSKAAFARALQKLVPDVTGKDLIPAGSGVRAQVVRPDGSLEEDFSFKESPYVTHVLNAPSPAATSCLAIGDEITQRILTRKS